jgi:IMP dehydrogenase/acetoin utilization protein AcuB
MTALPQTIGENSNLHIAKLMMDESNCHHLPVLSGGELVGMLSYYDLSLVMLTTKGKESLVKDVMSNAPYIVDPSESVKNVALEMLNQNITSSVVRAKGAEPWGIFTNTDALKIVAQI